MKANDHQAAFIGTIQIKKEDGTRNFGGNISEYVSLFSVKF
jgi:hypothetical protein